MAKTFDIKISGRGTADQIAVRLIEIGRKMQVANVYNELDKLVDEVEKTNGDNVLTTEIKEE